MAIHDEKIWAGSEASLEAALKSEESRVEHAALARTDQQDEIPRLIEMHGDVAIVNIKGSMNNDSDAWWNQMIGAVGYPEIRDAMIHLASDSAVKHIVLDVDSGGGSVSGLSDTAALVRLVHDKVKPVTAFASGNMFSAAYWLGSSAGDVLASQGSGVGSIGVIATHMERSKMLKDAGVGVTVVRAGKYKALANSVEPLSKEGEAQIQAGVDAAYKIFIGHVAEMRGKSSEFVDSVMAQGREFYGQAAADASLVDGITTFDAVMSKIKEKLIASSTNSMDNRAKQPSGMRVSNGDVMKTLSEQDIAALAAGAPLEASASSTAATPEAAAEPVTGAPAQAAVETTLELTAEVDTSAATLKVVMDQLKASQDDLLAARVELARSQDKVAELSAVVNPLKDIAGRAINNMRVALSGSVMDMSAQSPAQILAEHTAMVASFTAKFPVGGVASTEVAAEPKKQTVVDPLHRARVAAARFSK